MASIESTDCVVVGGGAVGLAIARQLALSGQEVIVLEAEASLGVHTSSRNSEVIHAGIYYPTGSLKAELCVSGRNLLYEFCEQRRIPFRMCGKLVVASDAAERSRIEAIADTAVANGVSDLEWLDASAVSHLEPAVRCHTALHSPSTGILDTHTYMDTLRADLEAAGGHVVCNTRVGSVHVHSGGFDVVPVDSDFVLRCKSLINSAGLWAPAVAASIDGMPAALLPEARFAKGHYFSYQGRSPFQRLVYPVPVDGGLGVHATLDLAGQARFGPDVEWVDSVDYLFDESRKPAFVEAIRAYYPGIELDRLQPGYTGIRPKLSGPGASAADFVVQGAGEHGLPGLVNLFGIESPGLTASLALARLVGERLAEER